jgi:hypothetical protein
MEVSAGHKECEGNKCCKAMELHGLFGYCNFAVRVLKLSRHRPRRQGAEETVKRLREWSQDKNDW